MSSPVHTSAGYKSLVDIDINAPAYLTDECVSLYVDARER